MGLLLRVISKNITDMACVCLKNFTLLKMLFEQFPDSYQKKKKIKVRGYKLFII